MTGGLTRRHFLLIASAGAGAGAAVVTDDDDQGAPLPAMSAPYQGPRATVYTDTYQIDIAQSLADIGEPEQKPQFIFIAGSNSEKGTYVNVDETPRTANAGDFMLKVGDSLAEIPQRDAMVDVIFIRSGPDKGTYVNAAESPTSQDDDEIEVATAESLDGIPTPDIHPALSWVVGGDTKGMYVDGD